MIDHFIATENLRDYTLSYEQFDSIDNLSDHLAISLQLNCNIESANKVTHEFTASPRWDQVHVDCYKQMLDVYLSNEVVPSDLVTCTDVNCVNSTCVETIHALHNSIILCLSESYQYGHPSYWYCRCMVVLNEHVFQAGVQNIL